MEKNFVAGNKYQICMFELVSNKKAAMKSNFTSVILLYTATDCYHELLSLMRFLFANIYYFPW